jgi:hypothetical protein
VLGAVLVVVCLAMFGAWAVAVRVLWSRLDRPAVHLAVGATAVAMAIGVLALPNQTSDIYDYAAFGRVTADHGGVPYQDLPAAHPDDPLLRYASPRYTSRPDNKLPIWTATAIATAAATGDSPLATLVGFRLLLGGCTVSTTVLIAWILRRIRPGAEAAGAAAFGLNPITLVYGTSKSDALMVLLLVLAIALVVVSRPWWATAAATGSLLVKLITAPVLSLLILLPGPGETASLTRRLAGIAGRAAIALAVILVAYGPLPRPLPLLRSHLSGTSDASVSGSLHAPATVAFAVVLIGAVATGIGRQVPGGAARARHLVALAAPVMTAFAIVLTRPGLPWYLLTCLALVALARSAVLLVVLGAASTGSFLIGWWDAIGSHAHPLPDLPLERAATYLAVAMVALVVASHRAARAGASRQLRVASRSG